VSVKKATAVKKPTPKSPTKKKRGRPQAKIELETIKQLCAIQCTQAEIATVLGVSRKTIERYAQKPDFAEVFANGRELGRVSVRRKQFELMNAGSVAMSIWLGKNLLGQSDEVKIKTEGDSITYAGLLGIIDRIESKRPHTPE
jgi:hypothetical protein